MRQLALDLQLSDYARLDTFFAGPNAPVLAAVQAAAVDRERQVHWIWGGEGSGRSHLLQAAVAAASERGFTCSWLPLTMQGIEPSMLEGMGGLDLLCIDDIDRVAGASDWETALFAVFEELRAHDGRLLVTASVPTAQAGFRLPDLASRLASGPTWKLQALNDDERLQALQLRAGWRGLELSDDVGRFLLRRADRSAAALFGLLDRLDAAALEEQRKLTIPFVKTVLSAGQQDNSD